MANNPLFSPSSSSDETDDKNAAADLIRQKLDAIYGNEPDAKQELAEVEAARLPVSKHQQFMQDLNTSGRSLAEIQTAWHNYYIGLPDAEKHQVWQEFYDANTNSTAYNKLVNSTEITLPRVSQTTQAPVSAYAELLPLEPNKIVSADHTPPRAPRRKRIRDTRSVKEVKHQIRDKVTAGGKLKAKHHFQSLAFGLGIGLIVVVASLFTFFNEVFISPFIQPNSHASTPIILDTASVATGNTPEVIIPKINVEIPVDYSQTTTDENQIENALENGVVHYPSTVMPGQQGNAAFFGHSSNNIFNPGKYKFAFVLLHELVVGDTFYLTNNGKTYIYKVISRNVVDPSDVGVLNAVPGQTSTATLITCDPPGTSLKRLVVVGQQISPDPSGNTPTTTAPTTTPTSATSLPGNGPSLWSRLWSWL